MKYLLLIALALSGCKIVSCPMAEKIARGFANFAAEKAECENSELLYADVMAFLDKDKTCQKPVPTGPIAMLACPILSRMVNEAFWQSKGPKRYGCKGGQAKQIMEFAMSAGCNLIPF